MSARSEEIRRAIQAIVDSRLPLVSAWCKVKSVSGDGQFCDVVLQNNDDLVIPDIMLGYDKSGQRMKPKVNYLVLVLFVTKTSGVVIMAEKTDEVEIMGTNYGEIPVVGALLTKINALEQQINTLKQAISTWVPVPNDGGAAFKTSATSFATTPITLTTLADIKGKAKHGNGL